MRWDSVEQDFWRTVSREIRRRPAKTSRAIAARLMRRRLSHVKVVAITGSCGKTTATALTAHLLARHGRVLAGLHYNKPKFIFANILGAERGIRYLVQEVSGHHPGMVSYDCAALRPDVGVVTMVGLDHYRSFSTREAVAAEKSNLVASLGETGVAVLNADDPLVMAMAQRAAGRVLTFGLSPGADLRASDVRTDWQRGLTFDVHWRGETLPCQTRLIGDHWVTAVLAGLGAALALDVPLSTCVEALADFETVSERCSRFHDPNGIEFILDTAKFPSWSAEAAFETLRAADAPRRTMVFGTVSDYGGNGSRHYKKLIRQALAIADRAAVVGPHAGAARRLAAQFPAGTVMGFDTVDEARAWLDADPVPGEVVLVKGSTADGLAGIAPAYRPQPIPARRYLPA